MKKFYFLLFFLELTSYHSGFSQNLIESSDSIYSFPFSTESKLLVFKGKMNGVDTEFVFDTGASMGLANSLSEPSGKLKIKGKKIKMRDSNNQVQKVKTGVSDKIQIGGFTFPNVRSLVNDMTYLYCLDFYLLGADVIRQLNWEIDFENNIIQVSKKPFPVSDSLFRLPVTYINNRPFVSTGFANEKFNRVLIDFGYTKVMDFPQDNPAIQSFLTMKDSLGLSNPNISSSMGALGLKTYESKTILVDSLLIGGRYFSRIPVDFEDSKRSKIGLSFFSNLSNRTILNNSESSFYLDLKSGNPNFKDPTHINLQYKEGKIVLVGKPLGMVTEDSQIEIGEYIAAVNGRKPEDFGDECEFMQFFFGKNFDQMELEKLNGEKLIFKRIPLK
ncbi:aspartyl protease family protein [Algoriphagus sp.]|uniref:aspartyl protease family protein n=1 Tax=Algoriphagus sp. TaxID=1872435 RepID=UPI00391C8CC4